MLNCRRPFTCGPFHGSLPCTIVNIIEWQVQFSSWSQNEKQTICEIQFLSDGVRFTRTEDALLTQRRAHCSGSRTRTPHWILIGSFSVFVSCWQLFTFHSVGDRVQSGLSTQHIIFDTLTSMDKFGIMCCACRRSSEWKAFLIERVEYVENVSRTYHDISMQRTMLVSHLSRRKQSAKVHNTHVVLL